MGVDVVWKDAAGGQIDRASDAPGWFSRALNSVQNPPRKDFPIMLSIDLYGDSVVMPPRTDALADELDRIRNETAEPEARIHIGKVLTLARAASSQPGSFLECRGD
jgi:hypothetical protein